MITRRNFSAAMALSPALLLSPSVRAQAAEVNDDGLHVQPFFLNTFLDLREDKAEADAAGKHLAVFFEQRGCPYCREMHEVNLARPEISEFVAGNFACLQLNLYGSREVTDFDGTVMEERELARRWFVNFTPTIVFFPKGEMAAGPGPQVEAIRMPGYFKPFHFISMFEFVHDEAFRETDFQRFIQAKADRMREEGRPVEIWEN